MILTPQNFHTWLKELKSITKKIKIWEYVDSNDQKQQSESIDFFEISDFQISVASQSLIAIIAEKNASLSSHTLVTRPAEDYEKLSNAQQKTYQMKIIVYQMKEKLIKKMTHDMKIINNALKASTRTYIPTTDMNAPIRDVIKALTDRYKRSDAQITQQIFEHFRTL